MGLNRDEVENQGNVSLYLAKGISQGMKKQ
jgi:hypothetical protein